MCWNVYYTVSERIVTVCVAMGTVIVDIDTVFVGIGLVFVKIYTELGYIGAIFFYKYNLFIDTNIIFYEIKTVYWCK